MREQKINRYQNKVLKDTQIYFNLYTLIPFLILDLAFLAKGFFFAQN